MVVTGKDMTPEDWDRLDGNIQTLLSKGRLTPEKMAEKLIRLGLRPAPAGDGGEGSVAGPWAE